jgi:hypothetical protein
MPSFATRVRKVTGGLRAGRRDYGWLRLPEGGVGNPAVKPPPYLPIYERLLASIRMRAFVLLELGVWDGHSLEMWRDASPHATIIGVDLSPRNLHLGPRVHVVSGDQADPSLMRRIREDYAPDGFDVVIDDASHLGITTARSPQVLYNEHLRPGGLYCIEDWGTGYLPGWHDGGPLESPVDVPHLDSAQASMTDVPKPIHMPSHNVGAVGTIKRLVDHVARGTVRFAQPEMIGDTLEIESMTIWDGIAVLRKVKP